MNAEQIRHLLQDVKAGTLHIEDAIARLRHMPFEDVGFACIDHHRHIRCGFPEVIYCPGKTTPHIIEIFRRLARTGHNVLATRAGEDVYNALAQTGEFPDLRYEAMARMIVLEQCKTEPAESDGFIAIITAGTADMPVAMEAQVTAQIVGQKTKLFCDVGVAGLHRLLGHIEEIQQANVAVVVAGMEGALASVVGGLVDCPVIAVPTSVGYGSSFEGLAALLAMLNSCASGVTVVNIDNGFGAGFTASIINRKINRRTSCHGNRD
ncbi:MAG TPA: nickel pincer cofactor biosynthesis protein LarB [Anaerohalosphaeraceae bacterium]|jgi:NCAIR mutase (PurE)-related protein|nr:nickel pincer cofactor biosynthesis protein LarB [Anaerohalosphaeraceae bacterium]HRT48954.1 nickel pincer cofactor biosynthesis protein LarB [Anaerohalosphaeraceae bacterium]HRT85077.1 nickel pincer cofactor biosynthesis protein LarB [Anaerohalosphaeraceae bacterium]